MPLENIIIPLQTELPALILFLPKTDEMFSFWVGYRNPNFEAKIDLHFVFSMDECIDSLVKAIEDADNDMTAFTLHNCLNSFIRMPFGL